LLTKDEDRAPQSDAHKGTMEDRKACSSTEGSSSRRASVDLDHVEGADEESVSLAEECVRDEEPRFLELEGPLDSDEEECGEEIRLVQNIDGGLETWKTQRSATALQNGTKLSCWVPFVVASVLATIVVAMMNSSKSTSAHQQGSLPAENHHPRPPLNDLIGDLDKDVKADVQFLMDFAIIGRELTSGMVRNKCQEAHPPNFLPPMCFQIPSAVRHFIRNGFVNMKRFRCITMKSTHSDSASQPKW